MENRRRAKMLLSVGLAVALLAYFLSRANLADVVKKLSHVRLDYFLLSVASSLATIPLRSWRWQFLLRPVGKVRFGDSFSATCIGFAASTILPARAGEVIRPVVLSRRTGLSFSGALASVAFERLMDLATVLAFVVAFVIRSRTAWAGADALKHPELIVRLAKISALLLLAFTAVSAWSVLRRAQMIRFVDSLSSRLPAGARSRIRGASASFIDGLSIVRDGRNFAASVVLSIALWVAIYLQIFFLFRAFDAGLSFWAAVIVCLLTLVGMLIPTPGAIGGFQAMCSYALTYFYGVAVDTATAFALLYWAIAFIPVTVIGFSLFAAGPRRSKQSLSDLAEAAAEE